MMNWVDLFSNGCIVSTLVMFAIGIPQCLQIYRQKKTTNIPFLPYLMTNVNNIGWIIYGNMTNNPTVVTVNVIGSILQTIYMLVHTLYADDKGKQIGQSILAALMLLFGYYSIGNLLESKALAINLTGVICCVITILMFASPLAEITVVIKEKSTRTISFSLTVASFACAGSWTLFGLVIHDSFIVVPNVLGVATSLVRFYLFKKYPSTDKPLMPI